MNIALIGYGKMGKEIEKILVNRGHQCILKISSSNLEDFTKEKFKLIDIAIEFTNPEVAVYNLKKCITWGVPVVTGSTGWYKHYNDVAYLVEQQNGSLFYATNFSIGVNIFFKLNEMLSQLMTDKQYEPYVWEQHHIHKKDHPSGTGITLAEGLLRNFPTKTSIQAKLENEVNHKNTEASDLTIICSREAEVPGTHKVIWNGTNDKIEITHEAFNRIGFAEGAVIAAEWLYQKKGIYSMNDMLKL